MTKELWAQVDEYLEGTFIGDDEASTRALTRSEEEQLPAISVSAVQGKLLMVLARMCGARRILEIGTLGAFSTIWLARALPSDGKLISLELEERHAKVARENLAHAGLADKVEIIVGKAADTLSKFSEDGAEPFDFIFIDADKVSYPLYLELSLKVSRPGTVIVADNVVRNGAIVEENSDDADVVAVRAFLQQLGGTCGEFSTVIQNVGSKGYDGLSVTVVS